VAWASAARLSSRVARAGFGMTASVPAAGRRTGRLPRHGARLGHSGPMGSPRTPTEDPMQGNPKVIHYLQAQLKNELTAINQYFVHYRMFKNWGFERMAKKEHDESIGEMKHADLLMERLFTLEALPNLQDLGKLMIGETLLEALACDLKSEQAAQATLKDAIAEAETQRDYVSRDLLRHILDDTEAHIDFLETQLELAGKVGEANYLQSQIGE
jgi:bacterioferritin